MTDKEFRRLNRAQLIEIIYQLQLQVDNLTELNQKLESALADRHLRISLAGNLAEAALEINDCFRSAQNAAEQYLNEIKLMHESAEAERDKLLAEARSEADAILSEARSEADAILDEAKRSHDQYDSAVEVILNEYRQDPWNDGGFA